VMYGPIVPLLIKDPDLRRLCYRAYNDWLAEFCATAPERLVGAGLIPIDDPKEAADEVRYLKHLSLRTGMFLAARVELPLWDEGWEPLWEAAAETGLPIGFHLGGGLRTVVASGPKAATPGNIGVQVACATVQMDEPLVAVIFSGALERHPTLKIVLAETGIGWLPYMLERMDDTYRKFCDAEAYWRTHGDSCSGGRPAATSADRSGPRFRLIMSACAWSTSSAMTASCGRRTTRIQTARGQNRRRRSTTTSRAFLPGPRAASSAKTRKRCTGSDAVVGGGDTGTPVRRSRSE
jgi:hypothetical protein